MADADGRKSHRFDQRRLLLAAPGLVAYDPKFLMVICHRHTEIDAQSTDRLTMALTALLKEERQSGSSLFRVDFPEVEVFAQG